MSLSQIDAKTCNFAPVNGLDFVEIQSKIALLGYKMAKKMKKFHSENQHFNNFFHFFSKKSVFFW